MKKLIQLITLSALVATFALPALAQDATASPSPAATAAQGSQGDEAAKTALYQKVMDNYKTNQPVAYEAAKEYLQKYPNDADAARMKWLQNFVAKYDKAKVQTGFPKLIADKKWSEAFTTGKQMLITDPENLSVLINLGYAGYLAAYDKNETFSADAINFAKQAVRLIESGKTIDAWTPFRNKDEALAYLNYALGFLNLKTNQTEAIDYFAKATQPASAVKTEPITYYYMALAYEAGPYKKQSDAMAIYENKPETPESKAALESLNQTADRVIDAYARAVSYATDPKYAADKTKWMARLTELYKFRHNGSDAGLTELIANVRNTPIPTGAPTATTPATTPASGATSATDSGAATGTTTTTDTSGAATTSTPATTTTTPASTTQPSTTTPATTTTPSGNPKATPTPTTTQPANKPKP
ncbi:MAG TPA: hypothetical protein VF708_00020 [Pyrinomonadaceae bacterium]|jgi:hypothetical protein